MSDSPKGSSRTGLVPAIRDLTDGVADLVRHRIDLLRLEIQREATEAGRRSGTLLVFGGLALLGYGLLNFAVVAAAGWWFGFAGLTGAALTLGFLHLAVGAWGVIDRLQDFEQQRKRIERKTEPQRSDEPWLETTEN